ncbi:hypothetical protein K3G39_10280 [Pontibacter sp. HSC-14F20]|uniref:M56 family metallopeptidase n=1 Tax=Pontibacter sp. HSC-14F20 TaxID=2864136 RepID=UPI001C7390D1|nr:M56 family metallopeptidase [Pontibacter sp. HSC-14F20]MBX0333624.1 hypothetical protein [Pontibacter sp. HSC-14F20]
MPALLLYLLKANIALVLFYLAYHLVLRKLTFYHLNRLFLVFGILFSAVYPLVDLSELFSKHDELAAIQTYAVVLPAWSPAPIPEQAAFDYWLIPVALFWLGCGLMLLRLAVQFASLYRIHRTSVPAFYQGVEFRKVPGISEAFSFWKTIYLNPAQHKSPELESILRHEQIHVNGWHTLDVLLAELSTVFYWFNPGVWLMKQAMKENLEFIADQHVVNAGVDRVAYQYLLLKVVGATQPQIANQFNFPSLKRRIAMMNKMPTNKANRLRLLVVLPLVTVLLVAFRSASQDDIATMTEAIFPDEATQAPTDPTDEYAAFYARNPEVNRISWRSNRKIVVALKSGAEEVYTFGDRQSMASAELKYGEMPSAPPVARRDNPDQNERAKKVAAEHKAFYARNPQVSKIEWVSSNEIRVRLESTEEIYNMADKKSRAVAEKKYGQFPSGLGAAQVMSRAEFESQNDDAVQQQNGERIFSPTDIGYYQDRNNLPVEYTNFLKRNPTIDKVGWKIHPEKGPQAVVLFLKSGTTEMYNLNDQTSMAKAKSKYGAFPGLLPPPPPVMIKEELPAPPHIRKEESIGAEGAMPTNISYFIDGKKSNKEAALALTRDQKAIHSTSIFKDEAAQQLLGDKTVTGVVSIITKQKKDSRQVQEFNKKLKHLVPPPPAAPDAPGTPPPPPAPGKEAIPPVPPAPSGEQLPPPPPTRYDGPAIPKAGGARLVETEEFVTYFLWPEEITKRELEVVQRAFRENNFDLTFNEKYDGGKISSLNIVLASLNKKSRASATYNAGALKNLLDADNIVIVQGNKKTGEVRIATTLAPR